MSPAAIATNHAGLGCVGACVRFGGLRAVDDVTFHLARGEIIGLIGPNGAGKSTLVNALSGFQELTAGTVTLDGQDISAWPSHRRSKAGVVRSFQAVRLFPGFTVFENLIAGGLGNGLSPKAAAARARELVGELNLQEISDSSAATLPAGLERRAGIARALATRPGYLLLDEPAAGLNESESDELQETLLAIRARSGCGICVIEHDMRLIMGLCERIQVLDAGRTIALGTPAEIQQDERVLAAYLGTAV